MVAASTSPGPPVTGPTPPTPSAATPAAAMQPSAPSSVLRSMIQPETTPGWLRRWGLIILIALTLFAVSGTLASIQARSSSRVIENNTAPALVGVQDLFSSVAEANTAATGAFLSSSAGTESRVQRNLYLDAIRRATAEAERVSSLVGDSESAHEALQSVGADLVVYSGAVESSRTANLAGLETAQRQLRDALDVTGNDVANSVATVTSEARSELDRQTGRGTLLGLVAGGFGLVALVLLVTFQRRLVDRTNRVFNIPLVAATVLLVGCLAAMASGFVTRSSALSNARTGGYDSIESTAEIQAAAFAAQTALSLELNGGQSTELQPLLDNVQSGIEQAASRADSTRERAAVDLLAERFIRYEQSVSTIRTAAQAGRIADATADFQGEGLSTFNGVNTSIESVLFDNRSQFLDGVGDAADATERLPIYLVVVPVLAALAALFGIQRRLQEYS